MLNYIKGLPNKLTRITSGGKLIEEIDGLRFLAIFPVVVQHMSERFERNTDLVFSSDSNFELISFVTQRGFVGVYIFFVISGFILALPFASHYINKTKKVNLKSYYWRRVTRLEPPYLISMTFFFIVLLTIVGINFTELFSHFLAGIFYLHNIIFFKFNPINPPVWTLEIEIQFYLLAPFLAILIFNFKSKYWRRLILCLLILGMLLLQYYTSLMFKRASMTILGHIQYFLIGFILADLYLCEWKGKDKDYNKLLDLVALFTFPALLFTWSWAYDLVSRIVFCILLFVAFYASFRGYYIRKFLKNNWIMAIGGMCYSIYLIHLPLAELVILFSSSVTFTQSYLLNFIIQLVIYLPILLVASIIFYLTIEKPCMDKNWPKKLFNKAKTIIAKRDNFLYLIENTLLHLKKGQGK